ncbi:MAG: META domain-containing protein [Bacteroidaceae bacterium]|jgi:heat shock protein HslJ
MNPKHFIIALAVAVAATACGTKKNAATTAIPPKGNWRITAVNGNAVPDSLESNTPYIAFDSDTRRIHGCSGCNIVNGNYKTAAPDSLRFGPLMTTMMACPYLELERTILSALEKVATCTPVGNYYELRDKDGKILIKLEKE